MRTAILIFFLLAGPMMLAAEFRQPLPQVHALVDVRVITEPGEVLDNATIVIRDGLIESVGSDIEIPADAQLIEFERDDDQPPITVYPGLIESYLAVEYEPPSNEEEDAELPPGRHSLIHPDRMIDTASWPGDVVEDLRRAGFTTALIAPSGGLLAGQSTLANLGDGGLATNRLAGSVAQHASLHGRDAFGGYPQSLMGSIALLRQTLSDARWQASAQAAWQRNPAQARPEWIEGLEALAPIRSGDQPLVVTSEDALDTLRIFDMISSDTDLVIVGNGREYQRLDRIAERGAPHILPLDFPDAPDVEEAEGDANVNRDVALEELRHWYRAPENPVRMIEAGVPVLLTSHSQSSPAGLFDAIAIAVERGLDAEQALAALTTEPAKWLGIEDRAGRIAAGYMANLLLVEGELLVASPTISEVWIDGHRFELAALEPPEVDAAGIWNLNINASSMGQIEGVLKLSGPPTVMQGSFTVMGAEAPVTEARVSGKQLQVKIDAANFGAVGTISINFDIDGERGRGSGSGPFGDFTLRGQRVSGPPPDEEIRQ
ncbi:MAG: amidohydrolase family protein [Pseudomonadota bacterium]